MPQEIGMPRWNHLYGKVYIPISNLVYESAIHFGELKIVDTIDPNTRDLSLNVVGDFQEKKAKDWITGTTKVCIDKGDEASLLHDLKTPSENIEILRKAMKLI